jgi:hypothetical protein
MDVHKMSSYNRLDVLKRSLFIKKLWFLTNTFVFLPVITFIFFVWIGPKIDAAHSALSAWCSFWGVTATIFEAIFCIYIFIKINYLREKIESIEYSISNR